MTLSDRHSEMFANRLRKTAKRWRKWAARVPTDAYRLYDRDIPEVPLLVDVYGEHLHISDQRFEREVETLPEDWVDVMVHAACEALRVAPERAHVKRRERQSGLAQYERVDAKGEELLIHEAGLRFWVNLDDYLDTGLFLDHRPLRARVRGEAEGQRVLNLFAYTGSFTVYAAAGGAAATTTVDLSNTYLDWARRNLELNELASARHERMRADTFDFLREARSSRRKWDMIVLDPPTFSNSKRMTGTFDVQRDHGPLIAAALDVCAPDGVVYFSTNRRKFQLDESVIGDEITAETVPEDFSHKRPHRCWRLLPS